jgi:hypothetical protein
MTQRTRAEVAALIAGNLPDNTSRLITPAKQREVMTDLADSAKWHDEGEGETGVDWVDITNKPATFPPSTHTHVVADVTGLDGELDTLGTAVAGKVAISDIATASQIWTRTAGKVVDGAGLGAADAYQALTATSGVVDAWSLATGFRRSLTISADTTINAPTIAANQVGARGSLKITVSGSSAPKLLLGIGVTGEKPVLPVIAGAFAIIDFEAVSTSEIRLLKGIGGPIIDTKANLSAANLVYPPGTLIIASDTGDRRAADGLTSFNSLPSLTVPALKEHFAGGSFPAVLLFEALTGNPVLAPAEPPTQVTIQGFMEGESPTLLDAQAWSNIFKYYPLSLIGTTATHIFFEGINRSIAATASFTYQVEKLTVASRGKPWTALIYVDTTGAGADVEVTLSDDNDVTYANLTYHPESPDIIFDAGAKGFFTLQADPVGGFLVWQISGRPAA